MSKSFNNSKCVNGKGDNYEKNIFNTNFFCYYFFNGHAIIRCRGRFWRTRSIF